MVVRAGTRGKGGWGLVIIKENSIIDRHGQQYEQLVTNNQMELCALLTAIHIASTRYWNEQVTIYCDSAYCVNICNDWIFSWATNGWKNSKKQQIENYEIIKKLWEYVEYPKGRWTVKKCAGHKGIIGNELADALAKNDKEKIKNLLIKIEGDGKNGINL